MDRYLRFHLTPENPGDDALAPVLVNVNNLLILGSNVEELPIAILSSTIGPAWNFNAVYPNGDSVQLPQVAAYVSKCVGGFNAVSGPIQDAPAPENFVINSITSIS